MPEIDWKKYHNLKNADLPNISDNELEDAVMYWMWGKHDANLSAYEQILLLPKPCQNVYSTRTVTDQVMNGGFCQMLFNDSRHFAEMSIEGYLALESAKLSNLVKRSLELYQQNKQIIDGRFDALRNGTRKSFYAFDDPDEPNESFTRLNEAFFEYDTMDYVKYIRLNANCFGD